MVEPQATAAEGRGKATREPASCTGLTRTQRGQQSLAMGYATTTALAAPANVACRIRDPAGQTGGVTDKRTGPRGAVPDS